MLAIMILILQFVLAAILMVYGLFFIGGAVYVGGQFIIKTIECFTKGRTEF